MTLLLQGVRKTNVILHVQRISISTNSNNGDFASAGSQENKWRLWLCFCRESGKQMWSCMCRGSAYQHSWIRGQFLLDLVSEDHETICKFMIFFLMNACLNAWDSMIGFRFECIMNAWYIFTCLTSLTFPLGNECMTLCWWVKLWLAWDHFIFNA